MRPLTSSELIAVSGGEEGAFFVTLPYGANFTYRTEPNTSVTLEITLENGMSASWNSGQFITCSLIGTGFALMGMIGGPLTSRLVGFLATTGCNYIYHRITTSDGDGM